MPASSFPEYAETVSAPLDRLLETGQAQSLQLHVDHRSSLRGFISGTLTFADDSELHFREFIDVTQVEPRLMYAYHYQDATKSLVFRYDITPRIAPLSRNRSTNTPERVSNYLQHRLSSK